MASVVQFTVDDSSPTVTYTPIGDTFAAPNLSAGWNPYWTNPGFSSATTGAVGSGTSLHITSCNGATLAIQWKGTGIQLFGNVTDSSYNITIDGTVSDASTSADLSNNTLFAIDNLTDTDHILYLIAQTNNSPDSLVAFDKALISAPPSPSTLNFSEQVLNGSAVFSFSGDWTFQNDSTAQESTTVGDSVSLQFMGTSFLLQGSTSPTAGRYSVTLDNVTTSFSGKSSFSEDDSLLFFASGLDAETMHDLKLTNTQGATLVLPFNGARVFALAENPAAPSSSPSSTPSSAPSTSSAVTETGLSSGTIAALVLGAVLIFLIVLGMLSYFLLYRPYRRRQQLHRPASKDDQEQDTGSILVVDTAPETNTTKKFYDDLPVAGPSRTSRRSGFSKWKEEVEGGRLGSWGRGALGIAFRHSDSTGRRDNSGSSRDYDMGAISDSYKSSSSSNLNGYDAAKGKGKARETSSRWTRRNERREKSLSPRFKLDLPIEPRSRSGSRSNAPSSGRAEASVISSLSYMSSPSLRPTPLPSAPPSATSRPSPHPNTHSRVGSQGALLVHQDEPPPSEPDDDYIPTPGPLPPVPVPVPVTVPTPPPPEPPRHDEPPRSDDRGSVRDFDVDDGRSILGDGTARIALRSLSPRTSEAEHRTARSKRRTKEKQRKMTPSPLASAPVDAATATEDTSPAPEIPDTNLILRSTSPFRVDFDQPGRAVRLSGQSRVRFEGDALDEPGNVKGGEDKAQSSTETTENRDQLSRAPFRLTPPSDHLRDTSFLDFASSSDGSVRTQSNGYSSSSRSIGSIAPTGHSRWSTGGSSSNMASLVPPPQPKSRWSNTTAPSSDIQIEGSGASSRSSNFPFPVSLPPSPHHPEGTFMHAPSSFATNLELPGQPGHRSSLNAHPTDLVSENATSPTDSVPMSISDIHFQHTDSGSGRHSSGGLPTHPPLPPAPSQGEETPYIVQRVVGMSTPSPTGNIVLNTPTPTAATFRASPGSAATSRPSPGSSSHGL
ncbi:hypothetical protein DFH07DRAFT_170627 [Mycena maculata]|uniref:Uncharacterized protein n=1 Tax=Mycena maculata TaxID=230809 RepID=A0AAD7JXP9_9AGAR|nr:hypothetical protein DFH07DRAFT_170627 [Mycena maculata]